MKEILIAGKKYPIEYTVEVQNIFAEETGDIKKVGGVFGTRPFFALSEMMKAAKHRSEVFEKITGTKEEFPEPLSEEELAAIFTPAEKFEVMKEALSVMTEACKVDVEIAPDKGKKTKSRTQSE